MPKTSLLPLLADGEFHSGQALAAALGVSRTAVWKQLRRLSDAGLAVESVRGRGYRLRGGLDLLDKARVAGLLSERASALLGELQIVSTIDSTNDEVLRQLRAGAPPGLVIAAEQQTAGRGRRGHPWVSPFARNIYVSIAWEFPSFEALAGLSLAAGCAVAEALERSGLPGVALKWPNDLLCGREKLGGILVDIAGDLPGACRAVIGIGVNVHMPQELGRDIDQRWTDIARAAGMVPERSVLLAGLLSELLPMLEAFRDSGFRPWRERWLARDAFAGRPVSIGFGSRYLEGTARGVDETGALLLETAAGLQSLHGGELSLREAS
jgi:BirA family biotin operon repressor/biotin-[acetyl-CoA-carboxylase] ligase